MEALPRLRLALAATAAAAAVAGCSGGDDQTSSADAGPSPSPAAATPSSTVSGPAATPAPTATPARGARTPTPRPGTSTARPGPGATAAPAATTVGAAPGTYPIHLMTSSSLGSPFDGPGTLTVSPAAAGGSQDQTLTGQGRPEGASTTYQYLPSGEVTIVAIGGQNATAATGCSGIKFTFTPPVEAVPPHLATGATWAGSVSGSGLTGSYSGAVVGEGTDSVGGIGVPVWRLHGSVTLQGTVCGFGVSGTVTLDSDWAPSLRLPVTTSTASNVTAGLIFHVTSTTSSQLLRTTPG